MPANTSQMTMDINPFTEIRPIRIARYLPLMLALAIALMACLGIIQDYFQSRLLDYGFFLSESLLFKAYLLPFLPAALVLAHIGRNRPKQAINWVIIPILLTLSHMLLSCALIHLVSMAWFRHTYDFIPLLKTACADDLYKYLLAYSALTLATWMPAKRPTPQKTYDGSLIIRSGKSSTTISTASVSHVCSDDPYSAIYATGQKHLTAQSLKELMQKLDPSRFVRIHRSTIINLNQVESYLSRQNGDYDLKLRDGTQLRISRSHAKEFKERLRAYSTGHINPST